MIKRIIPCLDCDLGFPGGRVVKGIEFQQIRYAGSPSQLAARYCREGADELVLLDITASHERRSTMVDVVREVAREISIPLSVGGGIRSVEDAHRLFRAGADKISINTAAIQNPDLIAQLSDQFGSQAVIVAIDAKRRYVSANTQDLNLVETESGICWYECSIYGGRKFTGVDAIGWAMKAQELGAGELLVTSMDRDGTKLGYDIPLLKSITQRVNIPVIASGGCGHPQHMVELFIQTGASAALAASIFHYGEWRIPELKQYLKQRGIPVRIS